MNLIGVLIGFIVILVLNSKKVNMGVSLLAGAYYWLSDGNKYGCSGDIDSSLYSDDTC